MKNRTLVFGAGGVGAKAKRQLEEAGYSVTEFSDNNKIRWGEEFEGCDIISPKDIVIEDYDFFAIGVYKAQEIIKKQLLEMGVEEKRIIIPKKPVKITRNEDIEFENNTKGRTIAVTLGEEIIERYFKTSNNQIDSWDFENNFWAFRELIDDILSISNYESIGKWWDRNNVSEYDKLKISFYYLEDGWDCFGEQELKSQIIISDSVLIERMAHNRNTYNFWKARLPRRFEKGFISKLESLKKALMECNIPIDEVAIVSGAVLQVYGLRDEKFADDVDIIMTDRFRKLYGRGLVIVSDSSEMHPQNEMKQGIEALNVSDDEIIKDIKYHFYFRGIKFCALKLLYEHRCFINDKSEVRLMEYFGCKH